MNHDIAAVDAAERDVFVQTLTLTRTHTHTLPLARTHTHTHIQSSCNVMHHANACNHAARAARVHA